MQAVLDLVFFSTMQFCQTLKHSRPVSRFLLLILFVLCPLRFVLQSDRANIDTVNRTAFKAAGRLVWQAMNGNMVLYNHFEDYLPKSTRVSEENCRKLMPLQSNQKLPQGFVNAHRIWNTYRELREAKTLSAAKSFLQKQSRLIPM